MFGKFWATNKQRCREPTELSGRDIDQLTGYTQSHSEYFASPVAANSE